MIFAGAGTTLSVLIWSTVFVYIDCCLPVTVCHVCPSCLYCLLCCNFYEVTPEFPHGDKNSIYLISSHPFLAPVFTVEEKLPFVMSLRAVILLQGCLPNHETGFGSALWLSRRLCVRRNKASSLAGGCKQRVQYAVEPQLNHSSVNFKQCFCCLKLLPQKMKENYYLATRTKINPQIKELRMRLFFSHRLLFPNAVPQNVLLSAVVWVALRKPVLDALMEPVWMDGRAGSKWG